MRKPTIYEALKARLGREPSQHEIKAEVARIITEAHIELAGAGKLSHQRRN